MTFLFAAIVSLIFYGTPHQAVAQADPNVKATGSQPSPPLTGSQPSGGGVVQGAVEPWVEAQAAPGRFVFVLAPVGAGSLQDRLVIDTVTGEVRKIVPSSSAANAKPKWESYLPPIVQ